MKKLLSFEVDVAGILAVLITLGFFGVLAVLATRQAPIENRDLLNIMLGTLGAQFVAAVQFYLGSSKGSQGKDATIERLSQGNGNPQPGQ